MSPNAFVGNSWTSSILDHSLVVANVVLTGGRPVEKRNYNVRSAHFHLFDHKREADHFKERRVCS